MEEVLVRVEVSDRDVVKLRPLQGTEATSDAYPGKIFQGVVENIGSSANPVTKGFEIEARIANPNGELRSGMITTIRVLLEKRSCLVVPEEALIDDRNDQARVLLVSGGIAKSVAVELGSRIDRKVEVRRGLVEGDEVIIFGQDQISDGQPVTTYQK
jgi:membrane fusion protein (multidrug efflux system)